MALNPAIQGARHNIQKITWMRMNGEPVNITGSILSGTLKPKEGKTRKITGTLTINDGAKGIFMWFYGERDVSEAGMFTAQFKAYYPDGNYEISLTEKFEVKEQQ